jgi:hypothetical protein
MLIDDLATSETPRRKVREIVDEHLYAINPAARRTP